jgi:hypothetical protein
MKLHRTGAIALSLWCAANMLAALLVTHSTLSGRPPPALALALSTAEIERLDARLLSVINAQAALANPAIMALCVLVLGLTWKWTASGDRFALVLSAAVLLPLQLFGFVSDNYLGGMNLYANVISTLILVSGFVLLAVGSRREL